MLPNASKAEQTGPLATPDMNFPPNESRTKQLMFDSHVAMRNHTEWSNLAPLGMLGVCGAIGGVSSLIWFLIAAQAAFLIGETIWFKGLRGQAQTFDATTRSNPVVCAMAFSEGALWGLLMLPFAETLGTSTASTFACTIIILSICVTCLVNAVVTRWTAWCITGFVVTLVPQCILYYSNIGPIPLLATISLVPILVILTRSVVNNAHAIATTQVQNEQLTAQLEEALEVTRYLACRDVLTGLLNRRAFEEEALNLASIQRAPDFLSLILIDLDHFKSINDTHGHAMGDVVLKKTASCLLELVDEEAVVCRGDSAVARWGGEEFIIVFRTDSLSGAVDLAEHIRLTLAAAREPDWPDDMSVTGSIGVAMWDAGIDLGELINRADRAMYSAKDAGRNRTRAFHAAGCLPPQFFHGPARAARSV